MQQAAVSQVKELDWQAQYEALRTARRLARHHPGVVAPSLHALVALAAPVIDALRSTLSRMAIAIFQVRPSRVSCRADEVVAGRSRRQLGMLVP